MFARVEIVENTIGIGVAPPKVERPKTSRTIQLQNSQTASIDGMVEPNHHLAWKKGNTWVMLVGGDLTGLPAPKQIAAAKLVFPVTRGHDKAAVKVGVSLLTAPIEAGKAFDFKMLGDVSSFAVVPKQPTSSDYSPPKEIEVDVSELEIGGALRVRDLALPRGVTTDVDPEEPVVIAAASTVAATLAAEEGALEGAEAEAAQAAAAAEGSAEASSSAEEG